MEIFREKLHKKLETKIKKRTCAVMKRNIISDAYKYYRSPFNCIAMTIEEIVGKNFKTVQVVNTSKKDCTESSFKRKLLGMLYISGNSNKYKKGYFYMGNSFTVDGLAIIWKF